MANGRYDDDGALLLSLSVKDEQAFAYFFEKYQARVYQYGIKVLKSDIAAEDFLHDVFLKMWQHNNISAIENLEHYLMTVARNQLFDMLKRQKLEWRTSDEFLTGWQETHNETEEAIFFHETEEIHNRAIQLLPPRQRTVYVLCHKEGLKYHEVAKLLSLSSLTVKTHMQLALRFVRNYLAKNNYIWSVFFITIGYALYRLL